METQKGMSGYGNKFLYIWLRSPLSTHAPAYLSRLYLKPDFSKQKGLIIYKSVIFINKTLRIDIIMLWMPTMWPDELAYELAPMTERVVSVQIKHNKNAI